MLRESWRVFASANEDFQQLIWNLKWELNQENAIACEAETSNSLAQGQL